MDRKEVDKRYLSLNKMLGLCSGVWPFEANISRKLAPLVVHVIALSSIFTQILRIVVFFSPDILIEQCPFLVIAAGIIIKPANYWLNQEKLKILLNGMYNDWEIKRTEGETEIMDNYGKRGVLFTIIYIMNAIFCATIFTLMPVAPHIKDYFSPIENATKYRLYIYPAYYPFDEDKYYIYFLAHMMLVISTVGVVYTACDTLYMYGVQHACGLLAVSGYRFKSAIDDYAYGESESVKTMDTVYKNVCYSIYGHNRALRFIKDIQGVHMTYLAVVVVLVIVSFSITLVKTSITEVGIEFYKYCGFLVVQLIHLFFVTIQGQFVLNSYDKIYDEIYDGLWYNASYRTQRLYVLALRGSLTAPVLSAGGLITLNLETFAEVLKASVSYFTVLKSQ